MHAWSLGRRENLRAYKTTFSLTPSLINARITIGFISMVLPVLQQDPKTGKKNWNQGTLIERQNLITLEKYVMKKDYESSILR